MKIFFLHSMMNIIIDNLIIIVEVRELLAMKRMKAQINLIFGLL